MATELHCEFCFDALISELEGKKVTKYPDFGTERYPIFVTWKIIEYDQEVLRGCIGTFAGTELGSGLHVYSIQSVSLLTDFEKAADYLDWEVGVHGIQIEFTDKKNYTCKATFLPEVALEQEWDKEETVDNLIRKAGHRHKITADLRKSLKVIRYKSSKKQLSYTEYQSRKKTSI
ncbi:hypothetical protein BB560_001550 [Smittium megazygosporum]|uniref:AMMECR1 domain-containing protein n=1 Tax=Smittium megazygosporum TaxID=133381 RepID=A0A2T9ZHA4_9FUNG|nr:hypothetical protein BB560_001550 [Smittium megazygosporum]